MFVDSDELRFPSTPTAFALDLDRQSAPNQVVVAVMPRQATLTEIIGEVDRKAAEWKARKQWPTEFNVNDTLAVPVMSWRLRHRFTELEGRQARGGKQGGLLLSHASQEVEFRIDRGGAGVASRASAIYKSGPIAYTVDRPYLVFLRKRGAAQPFFAMWVDNAELMAR
jgi:hypothetical protein